MEFRVEIELNVNMPEDRANANEIFKASGECMCDCFEQLATQVIEAYQEQVVSILCSRSGMVAKKGLGRHRGKGGDGALCRCRTFTRSGYWQDDRSLHGEYGTVRFRPAIVRCVKCGKRFTPVLDALELDRYQSGTDRLLQMVTESVAETSYRRGSSQLEILARIPVCKSTAHRWAASVELPVSRGRPVPFLGADGTGFKKHPGSRGSVNLVVELGKDGRIRPLGVWAGTSWKELSREVRRAVGGHQYRLLLCDGEQAIDRWLGKLARETNRGHWHLSRELGYTLWKDGVSLPERVKLRSSLKDLIAVEIPGEDIEEVSEDEKEALRSRIAEAEREIDSLRDEFTEKGYEKAASYLENARGRIFNHLHAWLDTGIIAPRTTSIVENIIRELVRRLKKVGWNWSDEGATRMGRIVMMRRYDKFTWEKYWKERMNLQNRCQISVVRCDRKAAA